MLKIKVHRNKIATAVLLVASFMVTQSVAQQGGQLTADEQRLLLQLMLKQQAATAAALQTTQQVQQQPQPVPVGNMQLAQMAEKDLQGVVERLPSLTEGVNFSRQRDGFSVNGRRYIDPEGQIVSYGFNGTTGDFTYLAQTQAGAYVIKFGRANIGEPITIATAEKRGNLWNVSTVTGKKMSGPRLLFASRGFVVARDNTGFIYSPGIGINSFSAPENFLIAALQNGDVAHTGHILLEKNPAMDKNAKLGAAADLVNSVLSLGSSLGISRKDDYALMNIQTGKLSPINISMDGKQVQIMSECRKRNNFVNDCAKMDSIESVYNVDGSRNMSHYFWRIYWFNTSSRQIMVSQEGGLSTLVATDLIADRKVILFERALGINNFDVLQRTDGTLDVTAQLGFSRESKSDILNLLDTLPVIEAQK